MLLESFLDSLPRLAESVGDPAEAGHKRPCVTTRHASRKRTSVVLHSGCDGLAEHK